MRSPARPIALRGPTPTTVTVPDIPAARCAVRLAVIVKGAQRVEGVLVGVRGRRPESPLGGGVEPSSGTTLWAAAWSTHCQVTVVPRITFRLAGTKRFPPCASALMTWIVDPSALRRVAVAVKVSVELRPPWTLAVADCWPPVRPRVQLLVLTPLASV